MRGRESRSDDTARARVRERGGREGWMEGGREGRGGGGVERAEE